MTRPVPTSPGQRGQRALRALAPLIVSLLAAGCDEAPPADAGSLGSDAGPAGPPRVRFDLEGGFFDAPYPSDLRTDAAGRPDLTGFPRRRGIVEDAADVVERERPGFSGVGGIYFRFSGPLDARIDPDPAAREAADSPVWLVDVDPRSPARGARLPAYVTYYPEATRVWPGHALVVRPVAGRHLHPHRRYAAVLRTSLDPTMGRSEAFEALKGAPDGAVGEHYTELFDVLEELGLPREEVLVATRFTTSDPVREMTQARDFVMAQPLPELRGWRLLRVTPAGIAAEATFDTYELLEGEPPYEALGSGALQLEDGAPAVVHRRPVRVGLYLPATPPPPGGFPVVLYGHGTGGDHETHFAFEGPALAEVGVATLGLEAALHGQRAPAGFRVDTLIAQNPVAAREVVRQTVLDMILLYRMLQAGRVNLPAALNEGVEVPLAASPVLYMGHSQGAQEAGVLLGVEPSIEAAFLSAGGSSGLITVAERDLMPGGPIRCLVGTLVGEDCAAMTEDHPVFNLLVQPLLEPADPAGFAHRFVAERPPGWAPLSIAMTEGTEDSFTPPRGVEALAVRIGLPLVEPVAQTTDAYTLVGAPTVAPPVVDNLRTGAGEVVTGGLIQFAGEGHFAIYDGGDGERRYVEFFRSLVESGAATIVGPP